jgi:ribosomal protein L37E
MKKAIFQEFPDPSKLHGPSMPSRGAAQLSREVASSLAARHCPRCGSVIYSRRHKLCGVCANPLPQQLLFSPAETIRVESLLEADKRKHRQWLAKEFAEAVAVVF